MIKKIEHIGIFVNDMEESVHFYTDILNMKLINRAPLNEQVELAFMCVPGQEDVQIELIGRGTDGKAEEGIVNHLAFTVEDMASEMTRLQKAGVTFSDEWPKTILDGKIIAFFTGPNGEKLELFQG